MTFFCFIYEVTSMRDSFTVVFLVIWLLKSFCSLILLSKVRENLNIFWNSSLKTFQRERLPTVDSVYQTQLIVPSSAPKLHHCISLPLTVISYHVDCNNDIQVNQKYLEFGGGIVGGHNLLMLCVYLICFDLRKYGISADKLRIPCYQWQENLAIVSQKVIPDTTHWYQPEASLFCRVLDSILN